LQNKGFAEFMAKNFDYWIVIEGLAGASGSTSWCRNLDIPARSNDGTHQFMYQFTHQNTNVIYHSPATKWKNKDEMVNEAIRITSLITDSCYLWQVDADEIWTRDALDMAELELDQTDLIAGAFQFDQLLCVNKQGKQLVGKGVWGSGFHTRLFKWSGQKFLSHEPPKLEGQTEVACLSQKYEHNSYNFDRDVKFKSVYYKGHEQVYDNMQKLKEYTGEFPVPITMLFGKSKYVNPKTSFIDQLNP